MESYKFISNTFLLLTESYKTRRTKSIRDTLILYYLNKTIKIATKSLEKIEIRDSVNSIIQFVLDFTKYKNEA